MSLRHWLLPLVAVLGALTALPTHAPATALPHLALKRSEPAADSRLDRAPRHVTLWFTARPQVAFTTIRIATGTGEIVVDSIVADTAFAVRGRIAGPLPPGEHRVIWRTASADGHPIAGEFAFVIAAPASDTAGPANVAPVAGAQSPAVSVQRETVSEYRTARWMEFVALLTVLGVLGFRHATLPPLASRGVPTADAADRARRLGQSALVLYFVAVMVRLYAEATALASRATALSADTLLPLLRATTWGLGWLAGFFGAIVLFAGWALSKRSLALGTPIALTGALGMVLSPALSGHAASSNSFVASITLDVVHIVAAGLWLGTLIMVLVVGIPAMRRLTDGNPDAAVSALVSSFHPLALFCAPLVVLAGLGSSWLRLGGIGALTGTPYGQVLLYKLALFAVVAGLGAYNAVRARKRLGTPQGTTHFRRTAALELLFAALVLAATTQLVTAPVPVGMVNP